MSHTNINIISHKTNLPQSYSNYASVINDIATLFLNKNNIAQHFKIEIQCIGSYAQTG